MFGEEYPSNGVGQMINNDTLCIKSSTFVQSMAGLGIGQSGVWQFLTWKVNLSVHSGGVIRGMVRYQQGFPIFFLFSKMSHLKYFFYFVRLFFPPWNVKRSLFLNK